MLAVTILGNNSALPAFDRHPTAQVVTLNENLFLVDCGEGTQVQIAKYRIKRSRIHHIFISHLHGDHYFGLMGLITSMGLQGRDQDLHLYGPEPLKEIIDLQMKAGKTLMPFNLYFYPLKDGVLIENDKFSVSCFSVIHRIETWGFIFREVKAPRKLLPDQLKFHQVPTSAYEQMKSGSDYVDESGRVVANDSVTIAATPGRSYAYAADTLFDETIALKVKGVNTLYHEATYPTGWEEKAAKRFHSTTLQAARIAELAEVDRLLIGHFSSKYETLEIFEQEIKGAFERSDLALEGVTFRV